MPTLQSPAAPASTGVIDKSPLDRRFTNLRPSQALALPSLFALALIGIGSLPSAQQHPNVWWSVLGAATSLLAWTAVLFAAALRSGRTFTIDVVLRKQHYVQACAHLSIFLYWGWYWRPVYDAAALIAAQLAFAYAFDFLLSWS